MGFQSCRIAQTTRFKGSPSSRKLTNNRKRDSASPPAAPFNNTSALIRQQSQHREEIRESSTFSFDGFDQYGSNSENMVACCSFATNNHDQDCDYQSQAQHPVIIGMSTQPGDHFDLHLQMQGLQITDSPRGKYVTHVSEFQQRHHSSNGASSAAGRELEDLASAVLAKGLEILGHRRLRSFTDDNFDMLEANASAMALDEIPQVDHLRDSLSDMRI